MVFSKRKPAHISLMMNQVEINQVQNTKFLGIVINSRLTWNEHVALVVKKSSKTIGMIAKVRHLLSLFLVRMLYLTLAEPYFNYCCVVWASDSSTVILDRLHKIQKKYSRLITFSHFQAHSQLKFLNTCENYTYHVMLYMYKHYHNMLP